MKLLAPSVRSRFTRAAWGVLLLAAGLVALSAAHLAHRFTLPTDGWAVFTTENFEAADWVYLENLVGAPSDLRRDDRITAIGGRSVEGRAARGHLAPPPGWAVGSGVEVRVARGERPLTLTVPVVAWTPGALWRHVVVQPELLVGLAGALTFLAVALFAFGRRPEAPAARALLVLSAAYLAINISGLLPDGLSVQFDVLAWSSRALFGYLLFILLLAPSLLAFSLLFPEPKRIIRRHPPLALAPYAIGLSLGLLAAWAPAVGWLGTLGMVAGALVGLVHAGATWRDAVSRDQLRWAGGGFAVGLSMMLLVFPAAAGWVADPLLAQVMGAGFDLGFVVIGVALAVAVLRHRLFDIDPVINRALVYATLTACVVGVYVLVVGYLGLLFRTEANLALSLVATGVVAVLFAPLRAAIQRGVNRLLYGERDEPYRVLTRLGHRLETAVEPSAALAVTVETVARALKLPYVAIALEQAGGVRTVAAYGAAPDRVSRFPLTYASEPIGALMAAGRAPDEPLGPADRRLLHDLARQVGVVAHAAALAAGLEQARLRLVTERGEARRQLAGDLHDGVGHQLAALTRQVERATRAAADEPAAAQALLGDVNRQLLALAQQVRALAHQLFPPDLALLGLVGALRERAQAYAAPRVQVDAPARLPPAPAEVEAAAYFIALEALTNVERHARATACTVRVRLVRDDLRPGAAVLEVTIRDTGVGPPAHPAGGLGLLSMQARAADVGGACRIEPSPGGGTAVIARLPYQTSEE